jgi:non-specific serine/threonine protein kinase/serine/threonine-protein kinase
MNEERSDRFARLKELFLALAEASPEERASRLDELGRSDPDLRAELESLMAQNSMSLDLAPVQDLEDLLSSLRTDSPEAPELPEKIGPYRIIGILGTGGMGVVYRAVQLEPIRREVALKVVQRNLDSRQVMNRFESERQALEMMDHPHIAKVLDAGADEHGNPYFVMELVQGVPITEYVQSAQLTIRQRLELFRSVCRAAHHAHTKGIIHRDLKPSNVLVSTHDGVPVPKIIDFGIAKATEVRDQAATLTQEGQLVGTLEYMSPEQAGAAAGRVDTRSDVYSLGLILYELLTGSLPYDVRGLPLIEAVRAIESARPRSLRASAEGGRRFDPDLETIVGKALEKSPDRRYGSAAELAEDVDRFLHSQPIQARPPSTLYQLRKLAARHKPGVALAATSLVFLVALAVVMSIEAGAQRRERARAEAEARKAERVNEFLQSMLASANPSVKDIDVRVRDVLDDAVREADFNLSEDPELESAVRRTIGNTYLALGLDEKAESQLRRALDLRRGIAPGDPALVAQSLFDLAACRLGGDYLTRNPAVDRSDLAAADTLCRQALGIRTDLWGPEHPEVAASLFQLGQLRRSQDRFPEAESLHLRALAIRERVLGKTHPQVAQSLSRLAGVTPDTTQGAAYLRRAYEIALSNHAGDHPDVASALAQMATMVGLRTNRRAEAESLWTRALEMERRIWGDRHPRTAKAMGRLAGIYSDHSRFAKAESLLRGALEIETEFHGANSLPAAWAQQRLGVFFVRKADYPNAESRFRQAVSIFREKLPGSHSLAIALDSWGGTLGRLKKDDEAIDVLQESRQILERVYGPSHPQLAMADNTLGTLLNYQGRYMEAEPCLRRALVALRVAFGERGPRIATVYSNLGGTLLGLDKLDEAETMFRKALAIFQERDAGDSWSKDHLVTSTRLGRCLHYEGRLDEAEAVLRETEVRFRAVASEHPQYAATTLLALGSLLVDRGKHAEADSTLCRALESLERIADARAGDRPQFRSALAACRAAQGKTAEADSLFRRSTPQAWTSVKLVPAARRIARARALRFYEAQGRADMVARIRSS